MADEKTDTTVAEPAVAEPTAEAVTIGAGPEGGPVPGDPSSEPVATAAQSHVAGRVGPPTIAQDSDAPWHAPEGVAQIKPGAVVDAATAAEGGPVSVSSSPAVVVAAALDEDAPTAEAPEESASSGESESVATESVATESEPAGPDASTSKSTGKSTSKSGSASDSA